MTAADQERIFERFYRAGGHRNKRLREWSTMPIIVLSAVGASNATSSPGPNGEPEPASFSAAGLEVDLVAYVVRRDGEAIRLTPTEFSLRRAPVVNRGLLMTHRALLTDIRGPEYADDVTVLRGQMANLRRKLEPTSGARRRYVRTEPGIGYRFRAEQQRANGCGPAQADIFVLNSAPRRQWSGSTSTGDADADHSRRGRAVRTKTFARPRADSARTSPAPRRPGRPGASRRTAPAGAPRTRRTRPAGSRWQAS